VECYQKANYRISVIHIQPEHPDIVGFLSGTAAMQQEEANRLDVLRRYGVLDTPCEEAFDRFARMAACHFHTTVGLVSFVDDARQWHKATFGLDEQEISRSQGFCHDVIQQDEVTVILDARNDPRFLEHPRVTGAPHIRFFVAAPIVTAEGCRLGMVAAFDRHRRRKVSTTDRRFLADLAAIVVHELEERLATQTVEREIAARRRIEDELEITNTRFRLAIANSPVVLCTEDRDLRYTWIANPPGSMPPEAFLGKTCEEIWPPDLARDLSALKRRALEQATVVRGSVHLLIGDRRHRFDVTYEPLFDRGTVVGVSGAAVDVTERHEAHEALKRALDFAKEAEADKARFLAAASHDLRQPVQSLFLLVDVLRNAVEGEPAARTVEAAWEATKALRGLLDSLLDIARLDAGLVSPQVMPIPLQPLLERLAGEAQPEAARKGLRLRTVPTRAAVSSDAVLLERILRNLVENALRYTDRGGILLGCRRRGEHLRIEVVDTGRGIPAEKIDEVFKEFVQLENDERDRRKGIGLGLAIVRRLAALLGHRVDVRSRLGHGTRFSVELYGGHLRPMCADSKHLPRHLEGRVLVIEDEAEVAQALAVGLEQAGLQVVLAANAEQALFSPADAQPDVIIADFRLRGGRTGLQAIEAVRDHFGTAIPGVLLTGDTSLESLKQAGASGSPLLHKPVTLDQLLDVVGKNLSSSRAKHSRHQV
jgi:two-component system, sensor histidine kinase